MNADGFSLLEVLLGLLLISSMLALLLNMSANFNKTAASVRQSALLSRAFMNLKSAWPSNKRQQLEDFKKQLKKLPKLQVNTRSVDFGELVTVAWRDPWQQTITKKIGLANVA